MIQSTNFISPNLKMFQPQIMFHSELKNVTPNNIKITTIFQLLKISIKCIIYRMPHITLDSTVWVQMN